ncbi:MAG: protocatechuate 4,5-dioxygenase subunit alpha [Sphingomonadales bacterium]|nr:protocatechuate 4,5-dioxygenase subunit alpha [Sphingomonadales bacterium]MDE2167883.1 protocatechuate 4,5-dioxygenase subunit alpha [Sphingomonadales bacterium]
MNATLHPISQPITHPDDIPGTTIFGPAQAMRGYALNAMCYSFNNAANREAFRADEAAYCARFGLSDEQRDAVARRDVLGMIAAGGNIYYLAKLAGIFGLNVQDVGALQTGTSVDGFRQMLLDQGSAYRNTVEGEKVHG